MIYYHGLVGGTERWWIEMPNGKYLWIRVEGREIAHGITTNHVREAASPENLYKLIEHIFTWEHI